MLFRKMTPLVANFLSKIPLFHWGRWFILPIGIYTKKTIKMVVQYTTNHDRLFKTTIAFSPLCRRQFNLFWSQLSPYNTTAHDTCKSDHTKWFCHNPGVRLGADLSYSGLNACAWKCWKPHLLIVVTTPKSFACLLYSVCVIMSV